MAFKHKKKIGEIQDMKLNEYANFLKKEIARAAKLGEVDAVICSKHTFKDGKVSSLVLLGDNPELLKYYKENKTKPEFAQGKCLFEKKGEEHIMHLAFTAGKAKPDKTKKAGKQLWAKLGTAPLFYKGELPNLEIDASTANLGEEALKQEVDQQNDQQKWVEIYKQYKASKKRLQKEVLPLLNTPKESQLEVTHFDCAKQNLRLAASLLDKYEELPAPQQESLKAPYQMAQEDYEKLRKIAAFIKKQLMANNQVDISDQDSNSSIQLSLEQLEEEFARLEALAPKAKALIEYFRKNN